MLTQPLQPIAQHLRATDFPTAGKQPPRRKKQPINTSIKIPPPV